MARGLVIVTLAEVVRHRAERRLAVFLAALADGYAAVVATDDIAG